jgi:hypothetical protein
MDRAKGISLVLIAAVLVAEFTISHLWPAIYFKSMHRDYYDSVVACLKAKESFQKTQEIPNNIDPYLRNRLLLASKVELSSCNEYELLKNKLISNGVDQSKLRVIYLEALKHKDLSLSSLVSPYEK